MSTEVVERLARIEAVLGSTTETLKRIEDKGDAMDTRLRSVEIKSASHGALAGGVVSLGIAYVTAKLKGA